MNNRMYEGKKIESKGVFSFDANDYLVCQYLEIKLDFNLALNDPMDSSLRSDESEFHTLLPDNFMLNFP